jgi:hypothetical protein
MIKPPNSYDILREAQLLAKKLGKNPSAQDCDRVKELAARARKLAETEIANSFKTNKTKAKVENFTTKIFEKFAKTFNKFGGGKKSDLGKIIIMSVLIGNIIKDYFNGVVSATQQYLNPDLSPERKKFLCIYDLLCTNITAVLSVALGPMALNKITQGYKRVLKPLEGKPKQAMIINGLSAFTTLALQHILAKRIIAAGISAPLAGKLKEKFNEKQTPPKLFDGKRCVAAKL